MGHSQDLSGAVAAVWLGGFISPPHLPAVAIVSLADHALNSVQRLAPTDRDLHDRGSRTGDGAHRFLQRRALLRHWIGLCLGLPADGIVVGHDASGRPELVRPGGDLFLSVSGRGDWAAFGLARQPIGIDAEPLEGGPIAPSVLTTREQGRMRGLAAAEQAEAFLRIWTIKEAYLKALGTGLDQDPALLEVTDVGDRARIAVAETGKHLGNAHLRLVEMGGRRFVIAAVVLPP